jgi:LysM repeat protein
MSTIRPLATIAVLAALGVFLAFKINEGPPVALNDEWGAAATAAEEPPAWPGDAAIDGATADATLTARSAPSWADSTPAADAEPAPAAAEPAPTYPTMPAMPAMPADKPAPGAPSIELPPVQGMPVGAALATQPPQPTLPSANNPALPLPASIPQANYDDGSTSVTSPTINGRVPSLESAQSAATPDPPAAPVVSEAPAATGAPGFAAAWQAVEMALERDELTRAHRMLSQWRAEPNLSSDERAKVEGLLSQLAGSVVYSAEHRLEPAYVVQPGDTLATIAEEYEVPWQLLAKINGVPAVDGVQPGQQLKVIRGPFDAEVDLARGELVLLLDERYAGRFPVAVEGQAPAVGEWRVGQKRLDAPNQPVIGEGQKVVIENPTGEQVELSAGPTPPLGASGRLTIASRDMADVYDILSVGSSVTVRR